MLLIFYASGGDVDDVDVDDVDDVVVVVVCSRRPPPRSVCTSFPTSPRRTSSTSCSDTFAARRA